MARDDADDELLPEIEDDAIVAQQAEAHAPAPRVQIAEESRTIVVEEPPPPPPARGRNDPTMVIRAVRHPLPHRGAVPGVAPMAPAPAQLSRSVPGWLPWVVWGVAGLIALALGGALAIIAEQRSAPPTPPPSKPAPAKPVSE